MAKISREEARVYLEFIRRRANKLFVHRKEVELSIDQAISDMEKLEKIEQMIDECRAWTDDMAECLIEIEKVVKEVE